jgi:hypothetical protein
MALDGSPYVYRTITVTATEEGSPLFAPFAPVIGRHSEHSWRRRMSRGRFLVQRFLPDATMPSPHAED